MYSGHFSILFYRFMFHGVVAFGNGHYISHIRRTDSYWEIHNDMAKKIQTYKVPDKKLVKPHLIVYTKV